MATVLISFIGVGRKPGKSEDVSKSGYAQATYLFPAENDFAAREFETTIFGAALLQRLNETNRDVSRWLLMGTAQSIWNDLIEIFPAHEEKLSEAWSEIDDAVKNQQTNLLSQKTLDNWQTAINSVSPQTEILCRIVGAADSEVSQTVIFQALLETVKPDDKIVFDITHGFRHQPVLASFMLMLLKSLRGVSDVEIYYGAFELKNNRQNNNEPSPVLKLSFVNDLLAATEAAAIFDQTGNYRRLGQELKLSESFDNHLESLFLGDEMHKPNIGAAQNIKRELTNIQKEIDPLKKALAEKLETALNWELQPSLARKWKEKAVFEFRREQYFEALAWLWEAVLIAGCEKYKLPHLLSHHSRKEAQERLENELPHDQKQAFENLRDLRNAVLHGSENRNAKVRQAVNSKKVFTEIFNEGKKLFSAIMPQN